MPKTIESSPGSQLELLYRAVLLSLCSGLAGTASLAAETDATKPVPVKSIAVAACLDAINRDATPDAQQCPGFVVAALQAASQTCREAEGTLTADPEPAIWELDVNGDGQQEMTFPLAGNVTCENAFSVFSCGSLGCPTPLYQLQEGTWREIGGIDTRTMESLSVVGNSPGQYGTLRVDCTATDCMETWYYRWNGSAYEKSHVDVRGHRVNFADSIHGLYTLVTLTRLLSIPEAGASFVARYPADTEVAIVGTSEKGDYYYVSPCNACESGFVEKSGVRPR